MTVVPFRFFRHRGRAASIVLAIAVAAVSIATPSRALPAQASEEEQITTLRLTQPALRRFAAVTKELAALIRREPSVARSFGDGAIPPAAARIFADAGMTRDEYIRFFGALFDASAAIYVTKSDPSAAAQMSALVKANVGFVKKNQAAIDALGPDLKTIQKAGDDA